MPNTTVTVVADTLQGHRLISAELEFPRIILSQFNKYGTIRSNTSSSRAIPVLRATEIVSADPYIPPRMLRNEKGMGGSRWLDATELAEAQEIIREIHQYTERQVLRLEALKVHKQHANRYLEPFSMVKVLATGHELAWRHMIHQRGSTQVAQPEFALLSELLVDAIGTSTPIESKFHVPYFRGVTPTPADVVYACGRAARTSYMRDDVSTDFAQRLTALWEADHLTPFEHVAVWMGGQGDNAACINPFWVVDKTAQLHPDGRVVFDPFAYTDQLDGGGWVQIRHIGIQAFLAQLESTHDV